jgi:predicted RNA binding protein YcfA (HicA-like mRNA interferase family)
LKKKDMKLLLSVPVHKGKNVKRGTLRALIKDAKMDVDAFLRHL